MFFLEDNFFEVPFFHFVTTVKFPHIKHLKAEPNPFGRLITPALAGIRS